MSARYVRIFVPAPMLERCDIIDTPGISDPNLAEDSWRFAVGAANFMIWCTSSTQAWRETERSTWVSLPERLRANSVLAVTRSDKIGQSDREKVARRLSRESFGLFGGLVFLATPMAVRGKQMLEQSGDDALWTLSGGAELDGRIEEGLQAVRSARMDMLERYESTGPAFPPEIVMPETQAYDAMDGVRPRRVELPETRRTVRPAAEEAVDPLNAMRGAWNSLRAEERTEPVVVHLAERVEPAKRSSLWIEDDEDEPLVALPPVVAPVAAPDTDVAAQAEPVYEGPVEDEFIYGKAPAEAEQPALPPALTADESMSLDAVLAAMAEEHPAPVVAAEQALPRAVGIWREIVARNTEVPPNSPIVAMIDQLLFELSREEQPTGQTGPSAATMIERTRAA
jgi:hypothetical protein